MLEVPAQHPEKLPNDPAQRSPLRMHGQSRAGEGLSPSSFGELLLRPPFADGTKHAAMSACTKIIAQPFRVGVRIGERDVAVGPDEIECRAAQAGSTHF